MKRRCCLQIIIICLLFFMSFHVFAIDQNSTERMEYFSSVLSLGEIEKYFSTENPMFLTDNTLKNDLQIKVRSIIRAMENSKQLMANEKGFYFELGKAYYISTELGLENNYDKTNTCFIEEIKKNPNNYGARVLLARNYMHDSRYLDAIDQYEYLRKNNLLEDALKLKAVAELYARKFDIAKKNLQIYIRSHPFDKQCYALIQVIDNGEVEEYLKKKESVLRKGTLTK